MIIDSLKNASRYENLNPYFKQAFEFLQKNDLAALEGGKIELVGKNLFVSVSDTQLKTKEAARMETHDDYIDIQVPVSCSESFGWKDRAFCQEVSSPYNAEKDIEFYSDVPSTYFTLQPGEFAVFFPEDGHAPCIGEGAIRKIIIKVKVERL